MQEARNVVIALGSVLGTIKDVVDEMIHDGYSIGVLGLTTFRPFPFEAVREALTAAHNVFIVEKAFQLGVGGIVTENVRSSLRGTATHDQTLIAGLGGRPITKQSLRTYFEAAIDGRVEELTFLDLDKDLAERELLKEKVGL